MGGNSDNPVTQITKEPQGQGINSSSSLKFTELASHSGQSYKHSTIVNYNSSVVLSLGSFPDRTL